MKQSVFILLASLLVFTSCEKEFGMLSSNKEIPDKEYYFELIFENVDNEKCRVTSSVSSVNKYNYNTEYGQDRDISAHLYFSCNGREWNYKANFTGKFGIDTFLSVPTNSLIKFKFVLDNTADTINGELWNTEYFKFDDNPLEIQINPDGTDFKLLHNLKDDFDKYDYIFSGKKVHGEYLASDNNITSHYYNDVFNNYVFFGFVSPKLRTCLPLGYYPIENQQNFYVIKIPKEYSSYYRNSMPKGGFVTGAITKQEKKLINVNKGKVYGTAITYLGMPLKTKFKDESEEVITITFKNKSDENAISAGFQLQNLLINEKSNTGNYIPAIRDSPFMIKDDKAIISLFGIGNTLELCPNELRNYVTNKKEIIINASLKTPDGKTIEVKSNEFILDSPKSITIKVNQ